MHGLINRTLQNFVSDTYGAACWRDVATAAALDVADFEAMLHYEPSVTDRVLEAIVLVLDKTRETLLEDVGTYLVSHPHSQGLRRLLRFGGVDFIEFLHSLDDLPGRARLAVPDLDLPDLELRDFAQNRFAVVCSGSVPGFGHVLVGVLRAMADDYGTLVTLEHEGTGADGERIAVTVVEAAFAEARAFELGVPGPGQNVSCNRRREVPV